MENLQVILSLLVFLGLGSSLIHYAGAKKIKVASESKRSSQKR